MRWIYRSAAVLVVVLAGLFVLAGPAAAEGEEVQGTLRLEDAALVDVRIVVTDSGGAEVGEATTDSEGAWSVPLTGPGSYTVSLDESSLPDDLPIRGGTRTVTVGEGRVQPVQFAIGLDTRQETSFADRAISLGVDGIRFGLIIAMAAIGLSLIFGTTGLTNFAHGELVTLGAMVAWAFNVLAGLPFLVATPLAVLVCAAFGGLLNFGLWKPLRGRGTGLISMMIISIGLAILGRYLIVYFFGAATLSFSEYQTQAGLEFGPISLTPRDLIGMAISIVVLVSVGVVLLRTRIGKAMRAVSDNPALASASGIDVERVIMFVWIVGAGLAALSGVLLGMSEKVDWQMGFRILLLTFAAVTLGGLGTAFGALVGALVVGVFVQMSTLFIAPDLKNSGALAILILILMFRPQGILGRAQRVG